jgi:hypothetical protein
MNKSYDEELNFGNFTDKSSDLEIETTAIVKYVEPCVAIVNISESVKIKRFRQSLILEYKSEIARFRDRLTELYPIGFPENKFPPSDDRYEPPFESFF